MPPTPPGWGLGPRGYMQPTSPALGYQQPAPPRGHPPNYGGAGRYGWQEQQEHQQARQGRDSSRGRGRSERVIPRCDADFPIPPPGVDVDEQVENCKVLSLQNEILMSGNVITRGRLVGTPFRDLLRTRFAYLVLAAKEEMSSGLGYTT